MQVQTDTLVPPVGSGGLASSLAKPSVRERLAEIQQRAQGAKRLALSASRLARERLDQRVRGTRGLAIAVTAGGACGLAGWIATLVFAPALAVSVPACAALVVSQCAPLAFALASALSRSSERDHIESEVEASLASAAQAERLGELMRRMPDDSAPAVTDLFNSLLTDVERAAAEASDRERAIRTPPAERRRRHPRIRPKADRVVITTSDNRKLRATILDVSESGVAIEGNLPHVIVGSEVMVGSRKAKAVRQLAKGLGFEFLTPLPPEAITLDLVL